MADARLDAVRGDIREALRAVAAGLDPSPRMTAFVESDGLATRPGCGSARGLTDKGRALLARLEASDGDRR